MPAETGKKLILHFRQIKHYGVIQEMRISFTKLWGLIITASVSVSLASGQGLESLEGTVEIDGSSTVAPISIKAADMFRDVCPKVKVPVGVSGTGGGFKRFTIGETDISDASRPIKAKEFKKCLENNVEFVELPVAYDGLTIVINKKNDWVEQLTVEQLKMIFRDDIKAMTWSDVQAGWPAEEIKIFAPGTDSGTFDYFKEVMVGKEKASIRADMSVSEDDNILVNGVANNVNAIGFFGAAYYFKNADKLKAVKVVNKNGNAVGPSPAAIESGDYNPFSRPLFIYVNKNSLKRPEVKAFVKHYLKNAADIADEVGYVGLPDDISGSAVNRFRRKQTGTHFLDENHEKRSGSVSDIYKKENLIKR